MLLVPIVQCPFKHSLSLIFLAVAYTESSNSREARAKANLEKLRGKRKTRPSQEESTTPTPTGTAGNTDATNTAHRVAKATRLSQTPDVSPPDDDGIGSGFDGARASLSAKDRTKMWERTAKEVEEKNRTPDLQSPSPADLFEQEPVLKRKLSTKDRLKMWESKDAAPDTESEGGNSGRSSVTKSVSPAPRGWTPPTGDQCILCTKRVQWTHGVLVEMSACSNSGVACVHTCMFPSGVLKAMQEYDNETFGVSTCCWGMSGFMCGVFLVCWIVLSNRRHAYCADVVDGYCKISP